MRYLLQIFLCVFFFLVSFSRAVASRHQRRRCMKIERDHSLYIIMFVIF